MTNKTFGAMLIGWAIGLLLALLLCLLVKPGDVGGAALSLLSLAGLAVGGFVGFRWEFGTWR